MKGLTVTFFGHKDAPKEIESAARLTLMDLIENKNANVFYVGNHGNFDTMVVRQLENLSNTYSIKYYVVYAYTNIVLIFLVTIVEVFSITLVRDGF